jgi:AcrR family transcriptional regulator
MRAAKTKTEIRQEQIATEALDLMARHGPNSLNLATLARTVGIVPSAIYRHYPDKDAVLDAVLELISERLRRNVAAVRQGTPDALERLHRLLTRHVQLICSNISIPRVFFSEEIFNGHCKRRQRVHAVIRDFLSEVVQIIREGQQQGTIRPDVPADTASLMFLGIIHPAMILWLTSDGDFDIAEHAESAWGLFRGMLRNQSEGSSVSASRGNSQNRVETKRISKTRKLKHEH